MHAWSQVSIADYRRLPLHAHSYFSDVPVYDVWRVSLPGVERSCTMLDVRATIRAMLTDLPPNLAVRSLFALRRWLGAVFRWDAPAERSPEWSWRRKLSASDVKSSIVPTGALDGPFSVLYVHATEAVSEIRNRTVQGFLVFAIEPAADGHTLYFAIHVLPVSAWTRPYLALIKPFRLWIVYPSLLRRLHEAWSRMRRSANR